MRKFLFFIILIISFSSFGKEINSEDTILKDGIRYAKNHNTPFSGIVIFYGENNFIKGKYSYLNGLAHGKCYTYYLDDDCYYSFTFINGVMTGQFEAYDYNNELKDSHGYLGNLQHGNTYSYSRNNSDTNRLYRLAKYENGKKHGLLWEIDPTSWNFIYIENYNFDVKHGISLLYYPNGNLKEQSFYINGKKHGTSFLFNEDGTLKDKTSYIYDEIGSRPNKKRLKNGEWHGDYIIYSDDGPIREKTYYENGIRIGETLLIYYHGFWGHSFNSKIWEMLKDDARYKTLLTQVEYREDKNHKYRLDHRTNLVPITSIYYISENEQGRRISRITYILMHYFDYKLFITIEDYLILSFIAFPLIMFFFIIRKKIKIKDNFNTIKQDIFIQHNLFFKIFENFNFLNTDFILIEENGNSISRKYEIRFHDFEEKLYNIINDKSLKSIAKMHGNINFCEVQRYIVKLIKLKEVNTLIQFLENFNSKYFYKSLKTATKTLIFCSGFLYAIFIIIIWGTLGTLIFNTIILTLLLSIFVIPLAILPLREYLSFGNLPVKISNLLFHKMVEICNLKVNSNKSITHQDNRKFDGKIILEKKELNFKNGVMEGKQLFYHDNGSEYITTHYKDGENVGPFKMYNNYGKLIYSIIFHNDEYILKIGKNTYLKDEQNLLIKKAKLFSNFTGKDINLSKDKEKIFYNLLKKLYITPLTLTEPTSFTSNEKYPYSWIIITILFTTIIIIIYLYGFTKFMFEKMPVI